MGEFNRQITLRKPLSCMWSIKNTNRIILADCLSFRSIYADKFSRSWDAPSTGSLNCFYSLHSHSAFRLKVSFKLTSTDAERIKKAVEYWTLPSPCLPVIDATWVSHSTVWFETWTGLHSRIMLQHTLTISSTIFRYCTSVTVDSRRPLGAVAIGVKRSQFISNQELGGYWRRPNIEAAGFTIGKRQ